MTNDKVMIIEAARAVVAAGKAYAKADSNRRRRSAQMDGCDEATCEAAIQAEAAFDEAARAAYAAFAATAMKGMQEGTNDGRYPRKRS